MSLDSFQLKRAFLMLSSLWLRLALRPRPRCRGMPILYIERGGTLDLGGRVTLNSSRFSNLLGLRQPCILVARKGGRISLGEGVGISGSTLYSWLSIEVGARTIIGANCAIFDSDFHPLDAAARAADSGAGSEKKAPIVIGEDCFIGTGVIVLPGTALGDRSVVGAGSVVKGSFPPDSVIAGNPARVLRRLGD